MEKTRSATSRRAPHLGRPPFFSGWREMNIKAIKATPFGPVVLVWADQEESPKVFRVLLSRPEASAFGLGRGVLLEARPGSSREIRYRRGVDPRISGRPRSLFSLDIAAFETCPPSSRPSCAPSRPSRAAAPAPYGLVARTSATGTPPGPWATLWPRIPSLSSCPATGRSAPAETSAASRRPGDETGLTRAGRGSPSMGRPGRRSLVSLFLTFQGRLTMADHPLSTMRKLDPGFMKRVEDADALIFCGGALPRRIKLLIAMAFDAANGAPGGVRPSRNRPCRRALPKRRSPRRCASPSTCPASAASMPRRSASRTF